MRGGILNAVKSLMAADASSSDLLRRVNATPLAENLRNADVIELNYTLRLKQRDEWIIQLRCNDVTEALIYATPELNEASAKDLLLEEAQELMRYLRSRLSGFHAKITGYYFLGSLKKEKDYGTLISP